MDIKPDQRNTDFQKMKYAQIGDYIIGKEIGSGSFGRVFIGYHCKSSQKYAIKKIKKIKLIELGVEEKYIYTEAKIMQSIQHPNILHSFDFIETKENYYFVVEYCNEGNLSDYIGFHKESILCESEAVSFLKQILNGYKILRRRNIRRSGRSSTWRYYANCKNIQEGWRKC